MKTMDKTAMAKTDLLGKVKLDFPAEGGVRSFIEGEAQPFPGMVDADIVNNINTIKRMIPVMCKYAWCAMRENIPDPKLYSRPVRELHRVFSLVREREGDDPSQVEQKGMWTEIRDILCMLAEYDDTYRFRLMDAINEMKKEEFEFSEADKYWARKKWKYQWGFDKNGK
jgi:hypothetical protein